MEYFYRHISVCLERYIINLGISESAETKRNLMNIIYFIITGDERKGSSVKISEDTVLIKKRLDECEKKRYFQDFFFSGPIYNLANRQLVETHIKCFLDFLKENDNVVYPIYVRNDKPNLAVADCEYDLTKYFSGWEDTLETKKTHFDILKFLAWHERLKNGMGDF
jgi:hypothetical protein